MKTEPSKAICQAKHNECIAYLITQLSLSGFNPVLEKNKKAASGHFYYDQLNLDDGFYLELKTIGFLHNSEQALGDSTLCLYDEENEFYRLKFSIFTPLRLESYDSLAESLESTKSLKEAVFDAGY